MMFAEFDKDGVPKGFYTEEIHGKEILKDKTKITDDQYNELLAKQPYVRWDGEKVVPYKPPLDTEAAIKKIRDEKIYGGIEIGKIKIKTDINSTLAVDRAAVKAKSEPNILIDWKTPDGWQKLDAKTIIQINDYIFAHVQSCFTAESRLELDKFQDRENLEKAFQAEYKALMEAAG